MHELNGLTHATIKLRTLTRLREFTEALHQYMKSSREPLMPTYQNLVLTFCLPALQPRVSINGRQL